MTPTTEKAQNLEQLTENDDSDDRPDSARAQILSHFATVQQQTMKREKSSSVVGEGANGVSERTRNEEFDRSLRARPLFGGPKLSMRSLVRRGDGGSGNQARQYWRTRLVWRQSLAHISAFLLTYSLSTLLIVLFYTLGGWKSWFWYLDIVAFILLPLQGWWNFVIYARTRSMSTRLGRWMKFLAFSTCCRICRENTSNDERTRSSGSGRIGSDTLPDVAPTTTNNHNDSG